MSKLKETQKSSEKIFSGKLIDLYFDHIEYPMENQVHVNG
ncbi:MAG: hypothetical protein CM1200mP1_09170 [Candidatus Neomarinimicrobiota bacterium]|nr:MAG: hypothetical protein CM1200mP1_09170 [Candidatus Neomarinimicrobiota bacterium]